MEDLRLQLVVQEGGPEPHCRADEVSSPVCLGGGGGGGGEGRWLAAFLLRGVVRRYLVGGSGIIAEGHEGVVVEDKGVS